MNAAPLDEVPIIVPPVELVHHLIIPPEVMPDNCVLSPQLIEVGFAVTEVGNGEFEFTVTVTEILKLTQPVPSQEIII